MIDILDYELKYKNDPMVIALLREYQKTKADFEEYVEDAEGGGAKNRCLSPGTQKSFTKPQ